MKPAEEERHLENFTPASHTFRDSFGRASRSNVYRRSAVGAERPILIPSIILLAHTRETHRQPAHSKGTHRATARIDTVFNAIR